MAFDRENPTDLAALKNEVLTDPLSIGYNPNGPTQDILNLLNLPANNPGGETGPDLVTAANMLEAIFPVSISSQDQFKIQLAFEIASDPSASLEEIKNSVAGLGANLQTAIDGISRSLSRGEVLFSNSLTAYDPLTITRDDWFAARDS